MSEHSGFPGGRIAATPRVALDLERERSGDGELSGEADVRRK